MDERMQFVGRLLAGEAMAELCQAGVASSASAEVCVEPGDGALDAVAFVLGFHEGVTFVLVHNQRGFDAEGFQRVPKFVGLRRRTLAVAVTDQNKCRRFDVPDESDRGA